QLASGFGAQHVADVARADVAQDEASVLRAVVVDEQQEIQTFTAQSARGASLDRADPELADDVLDLVALADERVRRERRVERAADEALALVVVRDDHRPRRVE